MNLATEVQWVVDNRVSIDGDLLRAAQDWWNAWGKWNDSWKPDLHTRKQKHISEDGCGGYKVKLFSQSYDLSMHSGENAKRFIEIGDELANLMNSEICGKLRPQTLKDVYDLAMRFMGKIQRS